MGSNFNFKHAQFMKILIIDFCTNFRSLLAGFNKATAFSSAITENTLYCCKIKAFFISSTHNSTIQKINCYKKPTKKTAVVFALGYSRYFFTVAHQKQRGKKTPVSATYYSILRLLLLIIGILIKEYYIFF